MKIRSEEIKGIIEEVEKKPRSWKKNRRMLCWVEMVRSLCSEVQMRWFQLEKLDLEVFCKSSKVESNRSYDLNVIAFLLKSRKDNARDRDRGFAPKTASTQREVEILLEDNRDRGSQTAIAVLSQKGAMAEWVIEC